MDDTYETSQKQLERKNIFFQKNMHELSFIEKQDGSTLETSEILVVSIAAMIAQLTVSIIGKGEALNKV